MSKRLSGGRNTLLNYFQSITSPSTKENIPAKSNVPTTNNETPKKTKEKRAPNDSDEEIVQPKKRKRIVVAMDSSEDEDSEPSDKVTVSKPVKTSTSDKCRQLENFACSNSSSSVNTNGDTASSSKTPKKLKPDNQTTLLNSPKPTAQNAVGEYQEQQWLHEKYDFLKPAYIRDAQKRRPDHPNYNPRTLYLQDDFLKKLTPAMRQWWEMKRKHLDCVLFFKVGKFYELYHMDAVIGVNELGFSYMKGEFAHSGFPEQAYGRFSSALVELGYKVARVEQTETPDMMQERCSSQKGQTTKFDKVVRREICQISNKATKVNAIQDLETNKPFPEYLYAICKYDKGYGVCFIDTTVGQFNLAQFEEDEHNSKLLTLLYEHPPAAILLPRDETESVVKQLIKGTSINVAFESLDIPSEFPLDEEKVLKSIIKDNYSERNEPPKELLHTTNDNKVKPEYIYAIRSLGAVDWFLKLCQIDIQLFAIGKFEIYYPVMDMKNQPGTHKQTSMLLDSNTLKHLNILGKTDSLQAVLDHCTTHFGKRLLKEWICRPLFTVTAIKKRQEAISEILQNFNLFKECKNILAELPDLEKNLARVHSLGNKQRATNHPDGRAIFYEEKIYSKKKIQCFAATLNGFEKIMKIPSLFENETLSELIHLNTTIQPKGKLPDLNEIIINFKTSFDQVQAEKEGRIIPKPGMDDEYDRTIEDIEEIKKRAEKYLREQEKKFGCKINYFGTDKKRFQLEIPDHATKKISLGYQLEGTKKGTKPCKRYHTEETREILQDTLHAEKANRDVLSDLNRRIFEKFSQYYEEWSQAVQCVAVLDCLISLATYVMNQSTEMTIPEILPPGRQTMLEIKSGYHPFIANVQDYIPNDTELGTEGHPNLFILTGPNMGGKSTLMRQTALLVILAQIGCHVPASSVRLTLTDRIFTRLGAKDDIIAGNSTFFVEMHESLGILQYASSDSLILLDELGRGTSTFDGTAIAAAYIEALKSLESRTMFSTHYYNVLKKYLNSPRIQFGHMGCLIEHDENTIADSQELAETVVFTYKMREGVCPKSYGFNAASLARVPKAVINSASIISKELELELQGRKLFHSMFNDMGSLDSCLEILDNMSL